MLYRLLLALFVLPFILSAADADVVRLSGGSTIEGIVLEEGEEQVRLLLPLGDEITLERADVAEIVIDRAAPQAGEYFRYHMEKDGCEGLDVAVTHLIDPKGGPRVDLVGVIHVADAAYYQQIQRLLDREALVLYEAVKPAGQTNEDFESGEMENPLRKIHEGFSRWFDLQFQLEGIDYDRPHFVHADMSAEEFTAAFTGEEPATGEDGVGESPRKLPPQLEKMLKQFEAILPLIDQMFSKPGPMRDNAKKMIAKVLASGNAEKMLGTAMPELTEVIIDQRNEVVVEKLREQLSETKGPIAIFYGAAHMRGLEARIIEKLGYRRAGAQWLRAWDLGEAGE